MPLQGRLCNDNICCEQPLKVAPHRRSAPKYKREYKADAGSDGHSLQRIAVHGSEHLIVLKLCVSVTSWALGHSPHHGFEFIGRGDVNPFATVAAPPIEKEADGVNSCRAGRVCPLCRQGESC